MAKRIAFLLPDLRGGGAERLTIDLVAGCLSRGHEVDLLVLQDRGALRAVLPAQARLVDLSAARLRAAFRPLRRYLASERPAGLIAALWPLTVVAIAATRSLRVRPRVVISEHAALSHQYSGRGQMLAMRTTMAASFRFADAVVGVSDGVADEIAVLARLPRRRVTTIHNPVGPPLRSDGNPSPWPNTAAKRILSVGAFKPAKNHRLLIDAFAELARAQDATLAIVGDGAEQAALEAQIATAGLSGKVLLPGFTLTPGDWYRDADLFVLTSDHEGFGNVLVEAMHCGLPVVATDCPSGPAEVLGGGRWGRLVPPGNATDLAAAMRAALAEPHDPASQRARADAFTVDRAVDAYLDLLMG